MRVNDWETLSDWLNAWTSADMATRDQLRARLAADRPDLLSDADALSRASTHHPLGFMETPAFVLAAQDVANEVQSDLVPGDTLGPYQIIALLARGGMGVVYQATDVRLQRQVALKVLAGAGASNPQRIRRFQHEARMTASLDHPNVVRVHDVGLQGERAFLVTELLEGETLRARLARGVLSTEEVLRIGLDIARGLTAAQAAGLVHRDLKPENVYLTRTGTAKILDFGIAKLTQAETARAGTSTLAGVVLGTAGYLAPEQIRGESVDPRADLFAVGALLFEMLTGQRAFERDHIVETLHAILHDDPPDLLAGRPDVPPELSGIVRRLLAKVPDARFQSSTDLVSALVQIGQDDVESSARPVDTPREPVPWWPGAVVRTPIRRSVGLAGVLAVSMIAVTAIFRYSIASDAPDVTLAVMPFISTTPDNEGLGVGLADVFISRLGQLVDMRVLPLTAVGRLRDERDPIDAARRLGATHLLSGRLQRDRGFVRATVQLIATSSRKTLWSSPVDTDASTLFAIEDIVVTRVLEEIAPQLTAADRRKAARPGTRNNEAYEAYLRGRTYVAAPTIGNLTRACTFFERAVSLDPSYADAWAALGTTYGMLPFFDGVPAERFIDAKRAAARAMAIAPSHAEALSVLGGIAFLYDWNFQESERLLRRAAELQPRSSLSYLLLAHLFSNTGRHDEALVEVRRARMLDPSSPLLRSLEGQFLFMARQYELALTRLTEVVALEPGLAAGHIMRAYPLIALGRYEEAVRECDAGIALNRRGQPQARPHSYSLALRGYALARNGRTPEAEQVLVLLRDQSRAQYVPPHHEALLLLALGRDEEVLVRLRDAVDGRDLYVTFVAVDPKWDRLRDVPAFRALMARANLLEVSDRARR